MNTAQISKTALRVSRMGLGTAVIGTLYEDVSDAACAEIADKFFELGLDFVDTAPFYGYGKSEERIGRLLCERDRDAFTLSTKVGRLLLPEEPARVDRTKFVSPNNKRVIWDFSYDGAMRSFEESLERLRTDRIDILLIHDADDHFHEAISGAYPALHKLREQGAIKAIGAGMNQWEMLARFAAEGDFDCFLLAGRYTLIDQSSYPEFLDLCTRKSISIIVGGPYNSGILASGAVSNAKFNYENAPPRLLEKVRSLDAVCARYGVDRKAAALQYPLAHPVVAAVIPGCRSAAELAENHRLLNVPIPSLFWEELRMAGIIPADAPVPADKEALNTEPGNDAALGSAISQ